MATEIAVRQQLRRIPCADAMFDKEIGYEIATAWVMAWFGAVVPKRQGGYTPDDGRTADELRRVHAAISSCSQGELN